MPQSLTVSVRALCEFAAKRGHLDHRFTPAPSASDGSFAHRYVQARRPSDYQSERHLEGLLAGVHVRGRADGYDAKQNRLEEIKTRLTHTAPVAQEQQHLHWAQAKVYAALLAATDHLEQVEVALVYIDLAQFNERVVSQLYSREELQSFANQLAAAYFDWHQQQQAHRVARDQLLAQLPFAFAHYRKGQRELAQAVYRNALGRLGQAQQLMVQAPTGIGKTLATLFGQLRAMPETATDKIFYLTARTTGRALALDAVKRLDPGKTLRVVELVAKEKSCLHLDKQCHPESCPLAHGFYDRLPAARLQAQFEKSAVDQGYSYIASIAAQHQICPYYLTHEMAKWADVIVADYQYFFDMSALLAAMTMWFDWRVAVLVDEAHSLTDRVRDMYTAQLSLAATAQAARSAPRGTGASFKRLLIAWRQWATQTSGYTVLDQFPASVTSAMSETVGKLLPQSEPQPDQAKTALGLPPVLPPPVLDWLFAALQFERVNEWADGDWLTDVDCSAPDQLPNFHSMAVRCVLPRKPMAARLQLAHSIVLFSATLAPFEAYRQLMGLAPTCQWLDLPSPFAPEQLTVRVTTQISTRYKDRTHSLQPLLQIMRDQYYAKPGNYLAFFSSYAYLQQAVNEFALLAPEIALWQQAQGMSEPQRNAYLDRFTEHGQGIGFAVLGGAFSEGIDLPGSRLIGAFVATLGLPQINPKTQAYAQVIDAQLGQGYEHMYLYPGLRKAVQAAGRVIRSEADEGVLWLLDQRYTQEQIRPLLPHWWHVQVH
jgi:DNA excision repair protein ERCC-2